MPPFHLVVLIAAEKERSKSWKRVPAKPRTRQLSIQEVGGEIIQSTLSADAGGFMADSNQPSAGCRLFALHADAHYDISASFGQNAARNKATSSVTFAMLRIIDEGHGHGPS